MASEGSRDFDKPETHAPLQQFSDTDYASLRQLRMTDGQGLPEGFSTTDVRTGPSQAAAHQQGLEDPSFISAQAFARTQDAHQSFQLQSEIMQLEGQALHPQWQFQTGLLDPNLFQPNFSQQSLFADSLLSPWPPQSGPQDPRQSQMPSVVHSSSSRSSDQPTYTPTTSADTPATSVALDGDSGSRQMSPPRRDSMFATAPSPTTMQAAAQNPFPPPQLQPTQQGRKRTRKQPAPISSKPAPATSTANVAGASPRSQPSPASEHASAPSSAATPRRQRNRAAASRCRARTTLRAEALEEEERSARARNESLRASASLLREEVLTLRSEILEHAANPACDCAFLKGYIAKRAEDIVKEDHAYGCAVAKARREEEEDEAVEGVEEDEDDSMDEDGDGDTGRSVAGSEESGMKSGNVRARAAPTKGKKKQKTRRNSKMVADKNIAAKGAWGTEGVPLIVDFSMAPPGGGASSGAKNT